MLHHLKYKLCLIFGILKAENTIPHESWDPRLKVMWLSVGHIRHFNPWKFHSVELWDLELKDTWLLMKTFIGFWRPENFSVMWPSNYRYLLSVRSFGGQKMSFFKVHETLGWRTYSNLSSFWRPKKAILAFSLNPPLEATGFMSTTAPHFGNIKMWFFKGHVSLGSMVPFFRCVTLRILKAWKCDSARVMRPSAQGYVITNRPYWTFWCPENTILTSSETLGSRVYCF